MASIKNIDSNYPYSFNLINFTKDANYKLKDKGDFIHLYYYKCSKIQLRKNIILDNDLAWLIGFFFADGTKSKNVIAFSNCELSLIKKTLTITETKLGIPSDFWKIAIKTSSNIQITRKFWQSLFLENQLYVTNNPLSNKDNLDIRINSRIFSLIFKNIIEKFLPTILSDKKLAVELLKGYFCGDGSINVREGCVHSIGAVTDNRYKKILIKACETFIGKKPLIRKTKSIYELYYSHVEIITFFVINEFFRDMKRQWSKLLNSYLKKQYTRSHLKYWKALRDKQLSAIEIAKITGNSHWSVRDAMNRDIRVGLIDFKRYKKSKERGPNKKYFFLSPNGKRLLYTLNKYIKQRGEI